MSGSSADMERKAKQKMLRRDMVYPRNGKEFHVPRVQYAREKREISVRRGQEIKLVEETEGPMYANFESSQWRALLINCFVNTFSVISWMFTL